MMIFFAILLGLAAAFLFVLPRFRKSPDPNLTAGKSSACGCFGLLVLILSFVYSAKVLEFPPSMAILFLIAFLSVPVIAILFSAWLAVHIHDDNKGIGKPPLMRTVLFFFLLSVLGGGIWAFEQSKEMDKTVDFATLSANGEKTVLKRKLTSAFLKRYSYMLESGSKQTALPSSFDGARMVNIYWLAPEKDKSPGIFLFADAISILAYNPATQEFSALTRKDASFFLNEKNVTSWNIPSQMQYIGMFSGPDFYTPEQQKEIPLTLLSGLQN